MPNPRCLRVEPLLFLLLWLWPGAFDSGKSSGAQADPDIVRMTVQLSHGASRGSGTVISSEPGLTLVLTAAHVVKDATDLRVELYRFNLGPTSPVLTEGGGWPRRLPATVLATNPATDVALVKVEGLVPLRYVAKLDREAAEPGKGEVLTSVGIDRGLFLTRWQTTIEGVAMVDLRQTDDGPRRFLVTSRHPEQGRSGGGLFREDGTVVGLCTGVMTLDATREKVGLFASTESVIELLREHGVFRGRVDR